MKYPIQLFQVIAFIEFFQIKLMPSNSLNNMDKILISNDNDLLDLNKVFALFKRQKKIFISITAITALISIIYSYLKTPVWRGEFEIVVESNDNSSKSSNNLGSLQSFASFIGSNASENKTQKAILKSPLVLKSVYNYVKEYKTEDSNDFENISFTEWKNQFLNVAFEEDTNVLKISYIDKDKNLIMKTLNKISTEYQNYSRRDRERSINQGIKYLEIQERQMNKKSKASLKNLNKFSIDNGLGDIDGFVELESNFNNVNSLNISSQLSDLLNSGNLNINEGNNNSGAGQRYSLQFSYLEKLEAQYTNLSYKLKQNSKTLTNLKERIDALKESLKRPNEILVKYRTLKRIASRDENLLKDIESRLLALRIEKEREEKPWELISKPTIDDKRISPKRKRILITNVIFAFIFSFIVAKIKDQTTDLIYYEDDLQNKIGFQFVGNFYRNNIFLNDTLLDRTFFKNNPNKKINIIYLNNDYFFNKINKIENLLSKTNKIIYLNNDSLKDLDYETKILLIAETNNITNRNFNKIMKFLNLYNDQIIGWVRLQND